MKTQNQNGNLPGEFTGRYLLTTRPGSASQTLKEVKKASGLTLASSSDFKNSAVKAEDMSKGDGIFLEEIGVAVINASDASQIQKLSATESLRASDESEEIIEPERYVHALDNDFNSYLNGYRDAVNGLSEKLFNNKDFPGKEDESSVDAEALGATWGLQVTRVVPNNLINRQPYTGKGIKVAVLDTGFDLTHPDFAGRSVVSQSFVPGQAVQDMHSHGTHCIGTACGPLNPSDPNQPRYGVAYEAQIYAGKVLANSGSGQDGWILAGINWAVANRCQVISMSLGALVTTAGYSQVYENAAIAALQAGCLIVAAAGNDYSKPVSHPANCPSIMAVGAVDSNLVKADFSNVTFYPPYGKVDIAGPGVGTFSSVPMPAKYGMKSGTSMATPHVAGVAALIAQSNATYRGSALWNRLTSKAKALTQPVTAVGSGLVQAPYTVLMLKPITSPIIVNPILKKQPA